MSKFTKYAKKLLALTLTAAALVSTGATLTGCSAKRASAAESNVIRVGMECNYAPFNWTTPEASDTTIQLSTADYADGYDVAMAKRLGEILGKEVEIVKLDWDNLILSLQNQQIDCIIAGMTDTVEREEEVNFTSPYYESEEVMIVSANSKYVDATSIQDFAGATIQGQMNTVYDEVIDQIEDVNHKAAAETFPAAIQALQSGAVDGVVSELPVAIGVTEANPDLTIVRFAEGQGFTANTTVSIAVRKTDPEFQAQLEGALSQITEEERNQMMEAAVERQPAENE
ncbi:putative lysine transport system substrate-binding protein [Lachnospiraceae bacterium A10]|nr:putative lysine transport system substrate-binding protein [Lachnospiraceae bacterium A10]